jgi:hypothetical protein
MLVSRAAGHPIVHRGRFVRTELLCGTIPSPPPDINTQPPPGTAFSERKLAEMRASSTVCGACHQLMDPLGISLESFDSLGRFRTRQADGTPVDPAGALTGTDVDGPFAGAVELAGRLASSKQVRSCVAAKMLSYAVGRELGPEDRCEQDRIGAEVEAAGGHLIDIFAAIAGSPALRYRTGGQ